MAYINIPEKDINSPLTVAEFNYLIEKLNSRRLNNLVDIQQTDPQDKNMIRHNGSGWVYYNVGDDHYTKSEINALFNVGDIGELPTLEATWGGITGIIRNQLDLVENFGDLKSATNIWTGEHYAKNYILDGSAASTATDGYMDFFYFSDGVSSYEITDKTTLKITGDGVVLDFVNKELKINSNNTLFDIHNATGTTLLKGTVVYPNGTSTLGVSNVSRCIADSHETLEAQIGIIYEDILDGSDGKVMIQGVLTGIDTSSYVNGLLYVSKDALGELTDIKPTFPDFSVLVGVVDKIAVDGSITVDSSYNLRDDLTNFWNGTIRESFKCEVKSDGTNVSLDLYPKNGHPNLTLMFSDGLYTLVTTPRINVALTAGLDSFPQANYVYILQSTKSVTVSTTGYPIGVEHIKVGKFGIRSAITTVTDGAISAHIWNDHIQDTSDNQGHISHITERLRQEGAKYSSGIDIIPTAIGASSIISLSGGIIYQLHKQVWSPFDMATGQHLHVLNHDTTPYLEVTDMNSVSNNSIGEPLSNSSFSIVYWATINSDPVEQKVFANLPSGGYAKNAPDLAVSDAYNFSDYTIPELFVGTGILLSRVTYIRETNGDWSVYDIQDLRVSAGGRSGSGGTGGVTTFAGLTDTPNTYTGFNGFFPRVVNEGLEYVDNVALTDINNVFTTAQSASTIPSLNAHLTNKLYVDTRINTREASLGNPTVDGYILSSTIAGVRSWIAPSTATGGDGNDYVDSIAFDNTTGLLTLGRSGVLSDLTKNLDNRWELIGEAASLDSAHLSAFNHGDIATNTTHRGLTNNPHSVDKVDVLLGNVDNTSDLLKPISTATQTALNGKSNTNHTHDYSLVFAPIVHTHDDRYYTETEVDALLNGKVDDGQVLTNVPLNALFTDTPYNDDDVLKDSDALTAVTAINKLITQSDLSGLGGGDMLKSVYDQNDDGVVDNSKLANGFLVEKAVPSNALFTDEQLSKIDIENFGFVTGAHFAPTTLFDDYGYSEPTHSIGDITGLQTALNGKVDDNQVLTNVPLNALFTDATYDNTDFVDLTTAQTVGGIKTFTSIPLSNGIRNRATTDFYIHKSNGVPFFTMTDASGEVLAHYDFTCNGTVSATDFVGTSDKRLKTDINISDNLEINSSYKSFRFKNSDQLRYGVIAQELEIEHPEFVRTDEKGYKSVSYIDLHNAEISYLKSKIKELEVLIKNK